MHKARLTEHQNIAVIKLVEAGRAVKDICQEADICEV
ncbi:transposase, partial [Salmonella enterica subsp. enterica serovar Montevideo]